MRHVRPLVLGLTAALLGLGAMPVAATPLAAGGATGGASGTTAPAAASRTGAATGTAAAPVDPVPEPTPESRAAAAATRDALPEEGPPPAPASDAAGAPQHLLVSFADGVPVREQAALLAAAGAGGLQRPGGRGLVVADLGGADVDAAVAELAADPRVAAVQPDHVRTAGAVPDDPLLPAALPYLDLVRAPRAWDTGQGAGAVVAVLDTGVDATHEDLAGVVLPGIDLVDDDADPSDEHWHGTAVAGVAAARGDNGLGAAGAAPGASVLPVRVLDASGSGSDGDVAAGIIWAADRGADVINLSLGGPEQAPVLLEAIRYAVAQGSVVVAAAGNARTEGVHYPAAYAPVVPGMVAVSATDDWGDIASFSSWGDEVSLAAPGTLVIAPDLDGGYLRTSGTSFASPLVSGAAALLAARGATPAQVESRLLDATRDAGPRGVDPWYGRGVLDMAAALGLGASLPLDRAEPDPGADDSVPDRGRALDLGATALATLSPEGDEDWYAVPAAARGWYRVVLTPQIVPHGSMVDALPHVTVLDADGALLGSGQGRSIDATVDVHVPVRAAGTVRIGVRAVAGGTPGARYAVRLEAAGSVRFSGTSVPVPWWRSAPAMRTGDVTGDGRPDVVHLTDGDTALSVAPGVGDGTLGTTTQISLGPGVVASGALALPDVDGDGDTDVVVGTPTGYVVLLRTSGGLVPRAPVGLGGGVWALETADLNRDGRGDLVLTTDTGAPTTAHLAVGDGTFRAGAGLGRAYGIFALGDVTEDGRPDVVDVGGQVHVQAADGTFVPGARAAVPADWRGSLEDVELADVTSDGHLDLVRSSAANLSPVGVAAGRGDGTFAATRSYPGYEIPSGIETGDVDGDGRRDVVVLNRAWSAISVLRQLPDGTLAEPVVVPAVTAQAWRGTLAVAHLDGDGALDVVVRGDTQLQALRNLPADRPAGPRAWVLGADTAPHQAGLGARPTLRIRTGRPLAQAAVTATTVRLVDGGTGAAVPAGRQYDAASRTITLTPSADLTAGGHYAVLVTGLTDADGARQDRPFRTWFTVGAAGERFSPVTPYRVLDTRDGTGAEPGRVVPGSPVQVELGGVEVPPDATAVVLNVTAVGPSGLGNVRVYPTPTGPDVPPLVSNLNVLPGVDQPNAVTVALGADGRVSLATDGMTAYLIADIAGYYRQGGATGYVPRDPVRVMDTRDGTGGVPARPVGAGRWVDLVVAGRNGVPADASAVVLNVTGTQASGATNVRVYPAPADSEWQGPPEVSNLNLQAGRDQPNLVTVAVGDGGRVRLYTQTASVHLVADLAGYYAPGGDHGFVPLDPVRVADSRSGLGLAQALPAGAPRTLSVAAVPADAAAVVMNVTAVAPAGVSNVRVFPPRTDGSVPLVSNLNVGAGRDEPNLAVVRLGAGRTMAFYSQTAALHLVVDVGGYFRR